MRVGLVQTMSIGDVIIALPIAKWFADRGAEVVWPVRDDYLTFLEPAAPYVRFVPVHGEGAAADIFVHRPKALIAELRCDEVYVLYNAMLGDPRLIQHAEFARHLKFDEHKYAVAGVPFGEKWRLDIVRDRRREERLFEALGIRGPYVCVHSKSRDFAPRIMLPEAWRRDYQVVEVGERTDSPFDWIATLERAEELLLIDSCFSNLVEQLNLPNAKTLILRSRVELTPVMKNGWRFYSPRAEREEPALRTASVNRISLTTLK